MFAGTFDVLDHVRLAGSLEQGAGSRDQVEMRQGVVNVAHRAEGLARRARVNEVESLQEGRLERQHVGLDKTIAAIVRLRLDIDAGHMEAGILQTARGAARAAIEVQRPSIDGLPGLGSSPAAAPLPAARLAGAFAFSFTAAQFAADLDLNQLVQRGRREDVDKRSLHLALQNRLHPIDVGLARFDDQLVVNPSDEAPVDLVIEQPPIDLRQRLHADVGADALNWVRIGAGQRRLIFRQAIERDNPAFPFAPIRPDDDAAASLADGGVIAPMLDHDRIEAAKPASRFSASSRLMTRRKFFQICATRPAAPMP